MSRVELQHIDKFYGKNHVLKDLDLVIEDGEFMTLLGPSGCGKTTTLRVIAGLENPQDGTILIDGEEVVNAKDLFYLPSSKRGLNLVFQSYALWPHMTVAENVAFGLSLKKLPKQEINEKVDRALERMQISQFKSRYPSELSGGQQQRVAIARAIVSDPKLLLMDEPLSNLDAKLRMDMRVELKKLHSQLGTTIIYVTHDQSEALTMSTKIAVFFDGVLAQVDTPINLYTNPASMKVADFIGNPKINFLECPCSYCDGTLSVETPFGRMTFGGAELCKENIRDDISTCFLGVRPEHVILRTHIPENAEINAAIAEITSEQVAGSETLVQASNGSYELLVKLIGLHHFRLGQKVLISVNPKTLTVYSKNEGLLIKYASEESED